MDRTAFEAELHREGRQIVTVTMRPGQVNPEHAHDFEARVMVIAGSMTVDYGDHSTTCNEGDTLTVQAGRRHAELAGPTGATYVAGRLTPAA